MNDEQRSKLQEIVVRQGGTVRRIKFSHPATPETFRYEYRFSEAGFDIRWKISRSHLLISIDVETDIVVAVGAPDSILGVDHEVGSIAGYRAFVRSAGEAANLRALPSELLDDLGIRDGESLLVARNTIQLLVRPASVEQDLERTSRLSRLARAVGHAHREPEGIDIQKLPEELRSLESLIEEWAVSDDDRRAEKVAGAAPEDLSRLWALVRPLFSPINRFLSAHDDDFVNEQAALHALAQAAHEARNELQHRGLAAPG